MFSSYLKLVDHCRVCGEPYGHIRSDDAAPWLTILVVGHIVVPFIWIVESRALWPLWIDMTLWPTATAFLTFILLPRAKGFLVSVIWYTGAPGSETG